MLRCRLSFGVALVCAGMMVAATPTPMNPGGSGEPHFGRQHGHQRSPASRNSHQHSGETSSFNVADYLNFDSFDSTGESYYSPFPPPPQEQVQRTQLDPYQHNYMDASYYQSPSYPSQQLSNHIIESSHGHDFSGQAGFPTFHPEQNDTDGQLDQDQNLFWQENHHLQSSLYPSSSSTSAPNLTNTRSDTLPTFVLNDSSVNEANFPDNNASSSTPTEESLIWVGMKRREKSILLDIMQQYTGDFDRSHVAPLAAKTMTPFNANLLRTKVPVNIELAFSQMYNIAQLAPDGGVLIWPSLDEHVRKKLIRIIQGHHPTVSKQELRGCANKTLSARLREKLESNDENSVMEAADVVYSYTKESIEAKRWAKFEALDDNALVWGKFNINDQNDLWEVVLPRVIGVTKEGLRKRFAKYLTKGILMTLLRGKEEEKKEAFEQMGSKKNLNALRAKWVGLPQEENENTE